MDRIDYPYQDDFIRAIVYRRILKESGAFVGPMGSGKTYMMAKAAEKIIEYDPGNLIIIAQPDVGLLQNNMEEFAREGLLNEKTVMIVADDYDKIALPDDLSHINVSFMGKDQYLKDTNKPDFVFSTNTSIARSVTAEADGRKSWTAKILVENKEKNPVLLVDEGHSLDGNKFGTFVHQFTKRDDHFTAVVTATPFLANEKVNILENIGGNLKNHIFALVSFADVEKAGRIVPPEFSLKEKELQEEMGPDYASIVRGKDIYTLPPDNRDEEIYSRLNKEQKTRYQKYLTNLWLDESKNKNLAILHMPDVKSATHFTHFAKQISSFPEDHTKAGKPVKIAYIDGERVQRIENGQLLVDEPKNPRNYNQLITDAREGNIDLIVNINVLREGVDIPMADLSILARQHCSLKTYLQSTGRTGRANEENGKKDHVITDLGGSTRIHWKALTSAKEGKFEHSSPLVESFPPELVQSYIDYFARTPARQKKLNDAIKNSIPDAQKYSDKSGNKDKVLNNFEKYFVKLDGTDDPVLQGIVEFNSRGQVTARSMVFNIKKTNPELGVVSATIFSNGDTPVIKVVEDVEKGMRESVKHCLAKNVNNKKHLDTVNPDRLPSDLQRLFGSQSSTMLQKNICKAIQNQRAITKSQKTTLVDFFDDGNEFKKSISDALYNELQGGQKKSIYNTTQILSIENYEQWSDGKKTLFKAWLAIGAMEKNATLASEPKIRIKTNSISGVNAFVQDIATEMPWLKDRVAVFNDNKSKKRNKRKPDVNMVTFSEQSDHSYQLSNTAR